MKRRRSDRFYGYWLALFFALAALVIALVGVPSAAAPVGLALLLLLVAVLLAWGSRWLDRQDWPDGSGR